MKFGTVCTIFIVLLFNVAYYSDSNNVELTSAMLHLRRGCSVHHCFGHHYTLHSKNELKQLNILYATDYTQHMFNCL